MALNFGVLDQGGPSNFFEGYSQGQEKMQANAMAQQKAAQAQQEFGMRQQEFAAGQADKQRAANTAIVTQRTAAARDAILNARTPDEARAIEKAQHADPYLGPIRRQFGSLEADLADIPNEATAFNQWKLKQALGAAKFIERMDADAQFASAMGGAQAMPQAAPTNAMAPAGTAAPAAPANAMAAPAMSGELQSKLTQRERLSALSNQDPRVKATIDRLDKEIARLSPAAPTPPASIAEFERAKTDPSFMRFLQERAAAMRPPAAPRAEQPPVAVVDPVTGKQVLVSREEALKGRMTPATAMEGLAPKEIQQREAKYPQATLAVKSVESSSDRLADDLETLAKHPGLSGISGLIYGNTPAITKDARVALEKYKSIVARGGFSELQAMRSASPTGGALGNVSNQENQYLRDAFAAIGRSQDTADLKTALQGAANAARAAKQRVRDAYDMTYDYKSGGASALNRPSPAAAPNIDALLNKYK
jgi:hypothetical protein